MEFFVPPTNCPVCGELLAMKGEYLVCNNEEGCSAQILGAIRRWVAKTGVLHFGASIIEAAVEAGLIKSLGDLYRISEAELSDREMEGRKVGGAARRAYESLHEAKEMPVEVFVGSLGIDLCGRSMVKVLVDAGFDNLEKLSDVSFVTLSGVPGFGATKALAFRKGFDAKKEIMMDLLAAGVTIKAQEAKAASGTRLKGVSVCFTGVRDSALEDAIRAEGGEIKSGVSKGLTILVCKDPGSTSAKSQKALELGTKVLSLSEMWALVNA